MHNPEYKPRIVTSLNSFLNDLLEVDIHSADSVERRARGGNRDNNAADQPVSPLSLRESDIPAIDLSDVPEYMRIVILQLHATKTHIKVLAW